MATSPIYGWTEPDNTGYVKNGALDMRTLGNAIDSTLNSVASYKIQLIHPFLTMGA